jgi:ATP-dependent DNA helicase RecG
MLFSYLFLQLPARRSFNGIQDQTHEIVGIQDFGGYTIEDIRFRINGNITNLNIEGFSVQKFTTSDTKKVV